MLRQAIVATGVGVVLIKHFGKALEDKSIPVVLNQIRDSKPQGGYGNDVRNWDFFNYRVTFASYDPKDTCFVFITDLNDEDAEVKKQVASFKKEFLDLFSDKLGTRIDPSMLAIFDPNLEYYHRQLKPKIALCGYSGVGKTTINRLIRAEEIPVEHVPTITGEIGVIKIGKLHFNIWDFAGQESFLKLWTKFIKGSDAVLIVTDSTPENVERSKYFISLAAEQASNAKLAVIANKQDIAGALPAEQVGKILGGSKAYGIIANDPHNRDKMINIIADVLEMNAEISPLLKPLIDRDIKMNEAQKALEDGNFLQAKQLFTEISELCLQLGDDKIANELYTRAEKIGTIIASMSPAELELYAPKRPPQAPPAGTTPIPPPPTAEATPTPPPQSKRPEVPPAAETAAATTVSPEIPIKKPVPGLLPLPGVVPKPTTGQPMATAVNPVPTQAPGKPRPGDPAPPSNVPPPAPGAIQMPSGASDVTPPAPVIRPTTGMSGIKPLKPTPASPLGVLPVIEPPARSNIPPPVAASESPPVSQDRVLATVPPVLVAAAPGAPAAAPAVHLPRPDGSKQDDKQITLVCPTCHAFHNIKVPHAAIKQITGLDVSTVIVSIPCGANVEIFFDAKKTMLDLRPVEILSVKYVIPEMVVPGRGAPAPAPVPGASDVSAAPYKTTGSALPELSPEEMRNQIQVRIQKLENHVMDLEISFLNERLTEKQYKALTGKLLSIKEQLVKQLSEVRG